ncbi:MAG TPA: methylated-DNA--[protein]-cysteine S-methyltransferase [Candidatus Limnocylindrales bacterium]
MTERSDPEAPLRELLRAGDPLPPPAALEPELAAALGRTRAALGVRLPAGRPVHGGAAWRTTADAARGPAAAYTTYPAPWGALHLAAADGGLVAIELRSTTARFVESLAARLGGAVVADQPGVPAAWHATLERARAELAEYFAGRRQRFDLPVDLRGVSVWDRRVLGGAAGLDYGEVTSYGRLARRIGQPRAARAVGGALGRNPLPIVIPCHRILAGDGSIGGYGGSHAGRAAMLEVKRTLLALEGVSLPAPLPG